MTKKKLFKADPVSRFTNDFREAIEKEKPIKHLYAICEAAFGLYSLEHKVNNTLYEVVGGSSALESLARESRIFTVKDWFTAHERTIYKSGITKKDIANIDKAVFRHVRCNRIKGLTPYTFIQVVWAGVFTQEMLMDADPSILRSMIPSAYDKEVCALRRELLLSRREKSDAKHIV